MKNLTVDSPCSALFVTAPGADRSEAIKLSRINRAVSEIVLDHDKKVRTIAHLQLFTYDCLLKRDGTLSRLRLFYRGQFRSFNVGVGLAQLFLDRVKAAGFELTIVTENPRQ